MDIRPSERRAQAAGRGRSASGHGLSRSRSREERRSDFGTGAPAGLGSRAYAFIVDWHVRVVVALLWLIGAYAIEGPHWRLVLVPAAMIYFLYQPVVELAMRGSSPGKRKAGLHIVSLAGEQPGLIAIVLRNALRLLDSLPVCYGLGILLMLADGRRMGDRLSGTVAVHALPRDAGSGARAALARELLERWDGLEPTRRQALARRLLGEGTLESGLGEGELKHRLQALFKTSFRPKHHV